MNENVATHLQQQADVLLSEDRIREAFSHYALAIEINPDLKNLLRNTFTSVLCTLGRIYENEGNYEELFASYEQALRVFNENEDVQTNLGAHLFRLGYLTEAAHCFKQALQINSSCLRAKRNLENVHNVLMERWHFRMLNDKCRNEAFKEAILKKVAHGHNSVLDIGTGSGILSLFAVEGGAKNVYACDSSQTMIEISKEVFARNNVCSKVNVLHKHSTEISIPVHVPQRVSLVITETIDAGLFGENILQTLVHAWDNLLIPGCKSGLNAEIPGKQTSKMLGHVIPHSGDIWVAAIECTFINLKYRLAKNKCDSSSDCLDFSEIDLFAYDGTPYDTLDLQNIPGGYRLLSHPTTCMHADFNDRDSMHNILNGILDNQECAITCAESGRIDAFAVWFTLQLDETISITSAPSSSANKAPCWDQAIFPLPNAIRVTKSTKLPLKISCKEGVLNVGLSCTALSKEPTSSKNSYCLKTPQKTAYPVSPEMITFLNDSALRTALLESCRFAFHNFHTDTQVSCDILDLSPFPIVGLTILLNERIHRGQHRSRLMCVFQEKRDALAIRTIAQLNSVRDCQLECLSYDELEEKLDGSRLFDIILVNPVDSRGCLNEKHISLLPLLRAVQKEHGLILPQEVKICVEFIHSHWLRETSQLLDSDRVGGYDIAPLINKYQVSEHLDVCLKAIPYSIFCDTIELAVLTNEDLIHSLKEPYVVKKIVQLQHDGCISAIPYWFKMKYVSSNDVSTLSISSFAKQAVILLNPEINVKATETISLTFICHQGFIHLTLQTEQEK